jgi:gas vesicle protein
MLKNLIMVGGSAMIMKEIADRVRQARIYRKKTLRLKKAGILALGVTIGSTVGVLAGVLFAPKAGKETRENLIQRGCEAWGKIQENVSHAGHRLTSAIEEKSSHVRTAAEKNADAAKGAFKESPKKDEGTDKKN